MRSSSMLGLVKNNSSLLCFILILLILATLPFTLWKNDKFIQYMLFSVLICSSTALSWNVIGGFAGQLHFGMAIFYGVGGYTSIIMIKAGVSPLWTLLVAPFVCSLIAVLIGFPCFRLHGAYFLITTISFAQLTATLVRNFKSISGGSMGISINPNDAFPFLTLFYLALGLFAIAFLVNHFLKNSRFGLRLLAINNNQATAESAGVNVGLCKNIAHVIAASICGVAGAILVQNTLFVVPTAMFSFDLSIGMVLMTLVGGIATVWGPIIGAFFYVVIRNSLIATFPQFHLMFFGLLLIIIVMFERGGLVGLANKIVLLVRGISLARKVQSDE